LLTLNTDSVVQFAVPRRINLLDRPPCRLASAMSPDPSANELPAYGATGRATSHSAPGLDSGDGTLVDQLDASAPETFESAYQSFKRLLREISGVSSARELLPLIVGRLAERPHVALARIWLRRRGDICADCHARPECPDQTACLHLVASAGRPLEPGADWSR